MRRLGLGSGALALAIVALAGCGGGDGDDSTAAPVETTTAPAALSQEELIAQADAICAEVNAAVGTVGSTSTGSEGQASQVAGLYDGMVERLQGLGAPSEDSAGYDEFLAAAEQLSQAESDVALAAERGEEESLVTAEAEASSALASFRAAASSYGLQRCGEAPSAPTPAGAPAEAPAEEASAEAEEEATPEAEEEAAPETGGAGATEEEGSGGGAASGGTGGGGEAGGGGSSGGIGPG